MTKQSYAQIVKLHLDLIENVPHYQPENIVLHLKIITDFWHSHFQHSADILKLIIMSQQQINLGCLRAIKSIALLKLLSIELDLPPTFVKQLIYIFLVKELCVSRYLTKALNSDKLAIVYIKSRQSIGYLFKNNIINAQHVTHLKLPFVNRDKLNQTRHTYLYSQHLFLYITQTIELLSPLSANSPINSWEKLLKLKCKNELSTEIHFNNALYLHLSLIGTSVLIDDVAHVVVNQTNHHLDIVGAEQADVQSQPKPDGIEFTSGVKLSLVSIDNAISHLTKKQLATPNKAESICGNTNTAVGIDYETATTKEIAEIISLDDSFANALKNYARTLLIKANTVNSVTHAVAIIGRERIIIWSLRYALLSHFSDVHVNHSELLQLIIESAHDEVEIACRLRGYNAEEYKLFTDCCLLPIFSLLQQQISVNYPIKIEKQTNYIFDCFKVSKKGIESKTTDLARAQPKLKNYIKLTTLNLNDIHKLSPKQQSLFNLCFSCILSSIKSHAKTEMMTKITKLNQVLIKNNPYVTVNDNHKGHMPIHYNQM
ncbi:hypothetical protein [Algibacillus agarilyticus]|uniref:hypothetical protein n=1 Tax=Algibacillus agarilyticus TaxID=2234133 RepID=UPI000DCFBD37|nr:hypothetical protein [Algibacillus agarilyticus]